VIKIITESVDKAYGNPSSAHEQGRVSEKLVNVARNTIADSLGVRNEEIYFMSSGTEANNLAIFGALEALNKIGGKIITTDSEHPSIFNIAKKLESLGYGVVYLATKNGELDLAQLENALDEHVVLISVMAVNNENGAVHDIAQMINVLDSYKVKNAKFRPFIHCDFVQAYLKLDVDYINRLDSASISAHKIHGLKGVGALYLKRGKRILSRILGGDQEKGLRSSTENLTGIISFGEAVRVGMDEQLTNNLYVRDIYNYAQEMIARYIPAIKLNIPVKHTDYILNMTVPNIKSEVMLNYLSSQNIYVSSGSACSSKIPIEKTGRVMIAYGLSKEEVDSTLRISFSIENDKNQIDTFVSALKDCVEKYSVISRYRK
jgi:cysteine desulfurase